MKEFDFVYREYSDEESIIYEKAINEILINIKNGMTFQDAIDNVNVTDRNLKSLIEDDALKILIAELCYVSKIPFEELAKMIGLPLERIRTANFEMLEDIEATLNNTFNKDNKRSGNA
ncbi:MAG: hypothetical protein N2647_04965 [Thermodesulfovibrio sp.]|nr:hypothetical protein [Thermodesulfovibrio sp.]